MLDLLRQGVIVPQIAARYPLSEVAAALVFVENRSRRARWCWSPDLRPVQGAGAGGCREGVR
ncbi:hypothetical protein ACPXB5_16290 [Micromonospora arida]|uniref:hypothetical protein n=1 Tax=Micromonospora arida TaxID=2203715 RepID=UPI0033DEB049